MNSMFQANEAIMMSVGLLIAGALKIIKIDPNPLKLVAVSSTMLPMRVILLQNVPKVGKKYDVVNVSDGYTANYLIPQHLAEPATPKKEAELKQKRELARVAEDARLSDLREKLHAVHGTTLVMTMRTDEKGHLYKKIHPDDVLHALREEYNISIGKDSLHCDEPIQAIGEYPVTISQFGRTFSLTLEVDRA